VEYDRKFSSPAGSFERTSDQDIIQRNGYFAHPENLLIRMLTNGDLYIRTLGVEESRKQEKPKARKRKIFDCLTSLSYGTVPTPMSK